jgi:hypothetical protein
VTEQSAEALRPNPLASLVRSSSLGLLTTALAEKTKMRGPWPGQREIVFALVAWPDPAGCVSDDSAMSWRRGIGTLPFVDHDAAALSPADSHPPGCLVFTPAFLPAYDMLALLSTSTHHRRHDPKEAAITSVAKFSPETRLQMRLIECRGFLSPVSYDMPRRRHPDGIRET